VHFFLRAFGVEIPFGTDFCNWLQCHWPMTFALDNMLITTGTL
jgi:hypothetical protein